MSRRQKGNIIYYIGLVGAILAPLIAAMTQFPVWIEYVDSGEVGFLFVFAAMLCCIPLFKHFKIALRSPTATVMWVFIFLLSWALESIIMQIKLIALVGLIANVAGAILCGVGNYLRRPASPNNGQIN